MSQVKPSQVMTHRPREVPKEDESEEGSEGEAVEGGVVTEREAEAEVAEQRAGCAHEEQRLAPDTFDQDQRDEHSGGPASAGTRGGATSTPAVL
jgi:hypothetical protein